MNKSTFAVEVLNMDGTPEPNEFVVARLVDGVLWYYGTYDSEQDADKVRSEFENGIVLKGD